MTEQEWKVRYNDFLRKVSQEKAQAIEAAPAKEKAEAKPEEVTAPDPDKA